MRDSAHHAARRRHAALGRFLHQRSSGMKVLRTNDRPDQKYSLTFVGYGDENDRLGARADVQLRRREIRTRRRVRAHRNRGARRVQVVRCDQGQRRASVTREAGPVKGGSTVIAFVEDPDGYKIELIERKPSEEASR